MISFRTPFALLVLAQAACGTWLPYVQGDEGAPETVGAKWWAHVGDHTYYEPSSLLGLSQNISHYYVARGSASALTNELRERLVASHDRWHIFHVPDNNAHSLIQAASKLTKGGRRSSISTLTKLQHGRVYPDADFPVYDLGSAYKADDFGLASMLGKESQGMEEITADSVNGFLTGLVGLSTRAFDNDTARSAAEAHVESQFVDLNGRENTCKQKFEKASSSTGGSISLHNVVTYVEGQDDTNGFVIMGAHFDSRPYEGPAPGANDNGSGVAAMLAVLKAFKKLGVKPKKSIYFVGFAAEEPGLWGSQEFVAKLVRGSGAGVERICNPSDSTQSFLMRRSRTSGDDVGRKSVAIIMDEVGWVSTNLKQRTVNMETFDEEPGRNTTPILQHIASSARTAKMSGDMTIVHSSNPFGSDHMSFLDESIAAVLLINGDDEKYPGYHSEEDKITAVDMNYIADIAKIAFGGLFRLANGQLNL